MTIDSCCNFCRYKLLLPRDNLLFVKTHKTGSSTIINLFQRYAYTHSLYVALPKQGKKLCLLTNNLPDTGCYDWSCLECGEGSGMRPYSPEYRC